MCVHENCACVLYEGLRIIVSSEGLMEYRVCREFESGEPSRSQSLARDGHPSICRPRLIVLNHGFKRECSRCAPPSPHSLLGLHRRCRHHSVSDCKSDAIAVLVLDLSSSTVQTFTSVLISFLMCVFSQVQ